MKPNVSARILADSSNPAGVRLTTFLLRYPRYIHSELMTHRAISRNASSSRAIPFSKMADAVTGSVARPELWAAEHKGMTALAESENKHLLEQWWLAGAMESVNRARKLHSDGLAKSLCNRLLEWCGHIEVVATATEAGWANFFHLRAHEAAEPTFQVLAFRMLDAYMQSHPLKTEWGQWHIPQFSNTKTEDIIVGTEDNIEELVKIATARCARLSYLTHDGEHSPEKDIELHDRLAASGHWSPFEHCAQAIETFATRPAMGTLLNCPNPEYMKSNFDSSNSLSGWKQYRKFFPAENITKINPAEIMARKPQWITLQ